MQASGYCYKIKWMGLNLNPTKCDDLEYIHFLMASVDVFTCTEAARCQSVGENNPSHDSFTRFLQRQPPRYGWVVGLGTWNCSASDGFLVIDDSTLDKSYAKNMDLVYHQICRMRLRSWSIVLELGFKMIRKILYNSKNSRMMINLCYISIRVILWTA